MRAPDSCEVRTGSRYGEIPLTLEGLSVEDKTLRARTSIHACVIVNSPGVGAATTDAVGYLVLSAQQQRVLSGVDGAVRTCAPRQMA